MIEIALDPSAAILDETCPAGESWVGVVKQGQFFRIVDLGGSQAVDTLFYNAHNKEERYSATSTILNQNSIYLSSGSDLISSEGNVMVKIVADTYGYHDTLGGACASESNVVRYGIEKRSMHNCRDNFLHALNTSPLCRHLELDKRDITSNVNFFMHVPILSDGSLSFAPGSSSPGSYVDMRAEMDVLVLISNCPQLNNPCNGFEPTPIRLLIWEKTVTDTCNHP